MEIRISLGVFYSRGDENRFFQGINDISAIKNICGIDRDLLIKVNMRQLSNEAMRELIALFWRYKIPLGPLRDLVGERERFLWVKDKRWYWFSAMFENDPSSK